jgi:pimeloyl-ACP methyl ester carboxylesterase
VDLHTIRHGDGPVDFVLVHGLASNARMWDGVGAELAARGHGSIAVDLRGHGRSPKPDDGYDFATVVADLVPLLTDRPVVAGQSYGGNVVVHLAARHPELVRAIACVDGGAIDHHHRFPTMVDAVEAMKPPYHLFDGALLADMEARFRATHADWPEAGIRGALANFDVDDEGRVHPILPWSRHRQIVEAMWQEPTTELFPQIEVPVLFLTATERMRAAVEAAVERLPNGKAIWFEGAEHDVHAQRPAEVAEALVTLR